MTKINPNKKCPYCGEESKYRLHRKSWMRLFSNSRLFECMNCRKTFLCIGVITIGTDSKSYNPLRFQKRMG